MTNRLSYNYSTPKSRTPNSTPITPRHLTDRGKSFPHPNTYSPPADGNGNTVNTNNINANANANSTFDCFSKPPFLLFSSISNVNNANANPAFVSVPMPMPMAMPMPLPMPMSMPA
jgi:hypothetical protein